MNKQLENNINGYSLDQHKEYVNNELAKIDNYTQYSEETRQEIKFSLFRVLEEINYQLLKIQIQTNTQL